MADTGSNALIITDTRSRLANIIDFVRGLDIRTPQLSIQAKIIFVDRTDIEQLGIKYDLGDRNQFFNKLVQRTDPVHRRAVRPERQRGGPGRQQRLGHRQRRRHRSPARRST